jgi:hypothetical protein
MYVYTPMYVCIYMYIYVYVYININSRTSSAVRPVGSMRTYVMRTCVYVFV